MGDHLRNLALLLAVGVAWGVVGPVQLSDDDVNPSALEMADSLLDFRCAAACTCLHLPIARPKMVLPRFALLYAQTTL